MRQKSRGRAEDRGQGRDVALVVASPRPGAQRVSFRSGGSWCRSEDIELRSGIRLNVTRCRFEPSFSFVAGQRPAEVELVVSKGGTLLTRDSRGVERLRGGHTLQIAKTAPSESGPLRVRPASEDGGPMDCVSLSMTEHRLRELLGSVELPAAIRAVTASHEPLAMGAHAPSAKLLRLLEEFVDDDGRGQSRALWLESKSLELVALVTDRLDEAERRPALPASDIGALERVRQRLVRRLDDPPTLRELARVAGFNPTKLKDGFRAMYGVPVFEYLRQRRMEEARRLLVEERVNVTEAAMCVGYGNPSKFAAAFRRQFGVRPSSF